MRAGVAAFTVVAVGVAALAATAYLPSVGEPIATALEAVDRTSVASEHVAPPPPDPFVNATWVPFEETFVLTVNEGWFTPPPGMSNTRYRAYGGCVKVRDRDFEVMRDGTVTAVWEENPALAPLAVQIHHDVPRSQGEVLHSTAAGGSPQVLPFAELRSWTERTTVSGFAFGVRGNATAGATVQEVELRLAFEYVGRDPLPVETGVPTLEWVPAGEGNGGCQF